MLDPSFSHGPESVVVLDHLAMITLYKPVRDLYFLSHVPFLNDLYSYMSIDHLLQLSHWVYVQHDYNDFML